MVVSHQWWLLINPMVVIHQPSSSYQLTQWLLLVNGCCSSTRCNYSSTQKLQICYSSTQLRFAVGLSKPMAHGGLALGLCCRRWSRRKRSNLSATGAELLIRRPKPRPRPRPRLIPRQKQKPGVLMTRISLPRRGLRNSEWMVNWKVWSHSTTGFEEVPNPRTTECVSQESFFVASASSFFGAMPYFGGTLFKEGVRCALHYVKQNHQTKLHEPLWLHKGCSGKIMIGMHWQWHFPVLKLGYVLKSSFAAVLQY